MIDSPRTSRQVEEAAIKLVLEREHSAGRAALDTRAMGGLVDIEGDWLIEVKAYGGSARGVDPWLETRQGQTALDDPQRFHLVVVEGIKAGRPRLLDIHGEQLALLLKRWREKHYFEVPFPTAVYDLLVRDDHPRQPRRGCTGS